MNDIIAQVEIWATANHPLREKDWLREGYEDLADYVYSLSIEGDPVAQRKYANLPICTFGFFDLETGEKEVVLSCETLDDLPSESVTTEEGIVVVEFNPTV